MDPRAKIEAEFAAKRMLRTAERTRRKRELRMRYPELDAAENAITSALTSALEGDREGELDRLIAARDEIIDRLGIRADFQPQYDCPRCRDEGYVDGKMCACLRQAVLAEEFSMSELLPALADATFEAFSLEGYDDALRADGKTDRSWMGEVRRHAEEYARDFSPGQSRNLIFYGKTGTGKTLLSGCIAHAIMAGGHSVLYVTSCGLHELFRLRQFADDTRRDGVERKAAALRSVDLLIIDDLGTEHDTPYNRTNLFDLVNHRTGNHLPVITSTNLSIAELRRRYDDRIFSRLAARADIIEIVGSDQRFRKE